MEWIVIIGLAVVGGVFWGRRGGGGSSTSRSAQKSTVASPTWKTTSKGNPTTTINGVHLTLFKRGGGWKFCVSEGDDDSEPHFSSVFQQEEEARERGLRWVEAAIPTDHDTHESLFPIVKKVGDEASSLARNVPDQLKAGMEAEQLQNLNDRLHDNLEAATLLQERAEDVDSDGLVKALEHVINMYEKLTDAVSDIHIETIKAERKRS